MKTKSLIALAAIALSACGGGGGSDALTTPTTSKSAAGVVGGQPGALTFGSQALAVTGSVTQNGKAATSNDVQPGDVIAATVVSSTTKSSGTLTVSAVDVKFEVKGALGRVDVAAGTLELFSQVVTTDALTRIFEDNVDDSYTSLTLADLKTGDFVEVSGQRQTDGRILATRIERKLTKSGDSGYSESELRGTLASLDVTAKTFLVGTQKVDYTGATLKGTLANGVRVEVEGPLNGTTIAARKVEVENKASGERSGEGELEGQATGLDATAKRFNLLGYVVDYSAATLQGTLAEGARVEVEGTFDATDANLLRASKVEVKHASGGSGSANGEVKGALASVDTTAKTFDVGNSLFYADAQSVIERDDRATSFDQLRNGDFVEAKFDSTRPLGGRSYAVKIELKSASSGSGSGSGAQEIKGSISTFNASGKSFTLNGTTVQVTASTVYEIDDRNGTEAGFFGNDRTGRRCEVKGTLSGTVFTASKIELGDD
ncbi:MAG: DUF5666 domain-containing protein [Stagnimonas sp.]|nr:DUF5666 domain-containing protein [Stagnimonas sp.]